MKASKILQSHDFRKAVKKLPKQSKQALDDAVRAIAEDVEIGEQKKGDLSEVRVYKFPINNQQMLLAYSYENKDEIILHLLKLASHENFYSSLKKTLKSKKKR